MVSDDGCLVAAKRQDLGAVAVSRFASRGECMAAERSNRQVVERYSEALPTDFDALSELRHADFVEEWPQSANALAGVLMKDVVHDADVAPIDAHNSVS
jgi:hypothetical protein